MVGHFHFAETLARFSSVRHGKIVRRREQLGFPVPGPGDGETTKGDRELQN